MQPLSWAGRMSRFTGRKTLEEIGWKPEIPLKKAFLKYNL
jgi:hypothetical protein